jgi:hypothetical protein
MDDNTKVLADDLLNRMGLADLPEEEKQETLENILVTLDTRVANRVAEELSEEQINQFSQMADVEDPDEQAIADWLKNNVPNYEQVLNEEAEKMRNEAQSVADKVMNKPSSE